MYISKLSLRLPGVFSLFLPSFCGAFFKHVSLLLFLAILTLFSFFFSFFSFFQPILCFFSDDSIQFFLASLSIYIFYSFQKSYLFQILIITISFVKHISLHLEFTCLAAATGSFFPHSVSHFHFITKFLFLSVSLPLIPKPQITNL